nr:retrovirus-related Pol polyprotein from transposon TNT 1-94 [Tanacetum cinerariifolium]
MGRLMKDILVGYSINSKAFRVFNSKTRIVQETLHINFLENQPNVARSGPKWMFDLDTLTYFNATSPSDTAVSPNFRIAGKFSFVDPSNYPNDLDMHALEDIVYSDNEEDVWLLVDLPKGKRAIGSKWVFRNKKDKRGIVIRNKARLVAQGHTEEEGIDYNEVFAPVARIEAIWLFLAYAFFMGFMVYQMDVKSAFLYGTIEKEVYVYQPLGFEDLDYPDNVYKVVKSLYGLHQAPRAWKFGLTNVESASTPIDTEKPLLKDPDGEDVDVHIYSLINVESASTPIDTEKPILKDPDGEDVDTVVATSSTEAEYVVDASCCAQFWATVSIKKANDVVKLQALIDRKKVIITEDVIQQDLRLDDADAVECLPSEEILAKLARMGYEKPPPKLTFYKAFFSTQWKFLVDTIVQYVSAKRTAWNEFSCSMASTIICLTTCRKFNFSKYIFDSMYTFPALTQKVFANMRRIGKGISGVETPLFASMLVQPQASKEEDDVELEQDKISQALEILKLKRTVKKLERKRRSKSSSLKRLRKVGTSQMVESSTKTVVGAQEDASKQGREIEERKDDDNAASKDVNAAEPIVFDDEEVTMTIAQTLIKMKAKKARLLDEQMAKRLHDKEVKQAATRENLKRKPISIAQARKNMIIYLKNMAGYKMEHFRGMTYDNVRPIFEKEYNKVQTLFKPDKEVEEPQKKRVAKEILHQESFKKLKAEAYHSFEDMLKRFDREDLDALWRLVKEKFSTAVPTVDKEKSLWVELKRLFEPDTNDVLWKLQRYMHYPLTWKLHSNCGVHQVSSTIKWHDMFMLTEKNYPLSNEVMTLMLSAKLQVEEDSNMARDLVMKIFMEANKPNSRSLDTSSK